MFRAIGIVCLALAVCGCGGKVLGSERAETLDVGAYSPPALLAVERFFDGEAIPLDGEKILFRGFSDETLVDATGVRLDVLARGEAAHRPIPPDCDLGQGRHARWVTGAGIEIVSADGVQLESLELRGARVTMACTQSPPALWLHEHPKHDALQTVQTVILERREPGALATPSATIELPGQCLRGMSADADRLFVLTDDPEKRLLRMLGPTADAAMAVRLEHELRHPPSCGAYDSVPLRSRGGLLTLSAQSGGHAFSRVWRWQVFDAEHDTLTALTGHLHGRVHRSVETPVGRYAVGRGGAVRKLSVDGETLRIDDGGVSEHHADLLTVETAQGPFALGHHSRQGWHFATAPLRFPRSWLDVTSPGTPKARAAAGPEGYAFAGATGWHVVLIKPPESEHTDAAAHQVSVFDLRAGLQTPVLTQQVQTHSSRVLYYVEPHPDSSALYLWLSGYARVVGAAGYRLSWDLEQGTIELSPGGFPAYPFYTPVSAFGDGHLVAIDWVGYPGPVRSEALVYQDRGDGDFAPPLRIALDPGEPSPIWFDGTLLWAVQEGQLHFFEMPPGGDVELDMGDILLRRVASLALPAAMESPHVERAGDSYLVYASSGESTALIRAPKPLR